LRYSFFDFWRSQDRMTPSTVCTRSKYNRTFIDQHDLTVGTYLPVFLVLNRLKSKDSRRGVKKKSDSRARMHYL
jgi:hypothetical protein